jgi:3,4-dihydroxy 2-butanone 4-phosphate synthase/GTP cyclohydrolase II
MQLSDWLLANKIKRKDFAAQIGVSPQTITGWCKGTFWIKHDQAKAVLKATEGAVTPTDFLKEDAA